MAYIIAILLSSIAFSSNLALISFIGVKAEGNLGIVTILAMPTLIPILAKSIFIGNEILTRNIIPQSEVIFLLSSTVFFVTISIILFPSIWKN